MTDLIMCGCGGKARHDVTFNYFGDKKEENHYIVCSKCGILTSGKTFEKAAKEWNTAMSGNRMRIHTVILDDNPATVSAKPYKVKKRWHCGACSTAIGRFWTYCQKCGTEIDWSMKDEVR